MKTSIYTLNSHELLCLMIAETFRNTCLFFILSFAPYYFNNVLKNEGFLWIFILANGIGTLLGAFAAPWIGVKLGKRHSYGLACIISGLVYLSGTPLEKRCQGMPADRLSFGTHLCALAD